MAVVVCPRCNAPNDAPADAGGRHRCVICDHAWQGAGGDAALTSTQTPPRARPRPGNPRVSQEYMPEETANDTARALTSRQSADPSGSARALPERPGNRGSELKPHSDRSHGGVIPPLKVLPAKDPTPAAPERAQPAPQARQPLDKAPGQHGGRVTPTTPTVEVDMDLFDRLENEAQVARSRQNTVAELTFEPAATPAPGAGAAPGTRMLACPVCGHSFVAASDARAQTCPQCHTSFDHASGRFATADTGGEGGDPLLGKTIRGCQIDRKLGEGGMGSVYHARQLSLDRSVAIKVLPPDLARNRNFIQRFEREAKSLAKINHPNILHIYDFGEETSLKLYFMIIEFVDGTDLGEMLNRRSTVPQIEVLDLLRQAALGLEMAAAKGVIHRDIKPDNLMIAGDGVCKVSDFGLAKGYGEENEVTSVGVRVGTPAFMSPEQCDGIEVDWRSDVYNLGCTAFLCLTGRLPFDGETPFSIMLKHKNDPIPSVREISPSVDPGVDRMIRRMLAKKPADRCDSWHSLIEELERIEIELSGDPNVLRKARGQLQPPQRGGPAAAPAGGAPARFEPSRVEEPRLPSPPELRVGSPAGTREPSPVAAQSVPPATPARSGDAALPNALPDWLRPVEVPGGAPAATPRPSAPASAPSPAPAQAARAWSPTGSPAPSASDGRASSAEVRTSGGDAYAERPGRPSKRLNVELGPARERGLRSESESMAASAERLVAAGRFDEAAREFRKASEVSPDPAWSDQLRERASDARSRGRLKRVARRLATVFVGLGLAGAVAWQATPPVHNMLAQRDFEAIAADTTRDARARADKLRAFSAAQQPYDWYLSLFRKGYAIDAAREAITRAEETELLLTGKPAGPRTGTTPLRELEAAFVDPAVTLPEVIERAAALAASSDGRDRERSEEIRSLAQLQVAKMQPDLKGIEDLLREGRIRDALERAAQFRAAYPRAGAVAAGLPLPARLAIRSEDGRQIEPDIRVDGRPHPTGERLFGRRGNRPTTVDISAAGFAPVRLEVPPDAGVEERTVEAVLAVAPVWTRSLGSAVERTALHAAGDDLFAHRPDGVALLRGADGDIIATLEPLPGATGPSYTPLWIEHGDRVLIGCEDGQVRLVDRRTLSVLKVAHRGKASVHAWFETQLTYRAGEQAGYLVEDQRGARRVVATMAGQEWWTYRGIGGTQPPHLARCGDRIAVIDDTAAHFLEEDGSDVQIIDLAADRTGAVAALPGDAGVLVPTQSGPQWLRFGPRQSPLQPVDDPLLAGGRAELAVDGTLVVLARDGVVAAATLDTGRLAPRWRADMAAVAQLSAAEGAVAAADANGRVRVWSAADGRLLVSFAHRGPLAGPPLLRDGMVVVADRAGTVAAYAIK